jgi:hypothetical protein
MHPNFPNITADVNRIPSAPSLIFALYCAFDMELSQCLLSTKDAQESASVDPLLIFRPH